MGGVKVAKRGLYWAGTFYFRAEHLEQARKERQGYLRVCKYQAKAQYSKAVVFHDGTDTAL